MRLKSAITGAVWPAIPSGTGATLLALLDQLEDSQYWPPERLREHQLLQLEQLWRFAWGIPYWAKRLRRTGWEPGARLTWEHFQALPLLDRAVVQQRSPDLTGTQPADHGKAKEVLTSGSTGRPVRIQRTELANIYWHALALRDHVWHGRDLTKKMALIRHVVGQEYARPPHGVREDDWGPPASLVAETGPAVRLAIRSDVHDQAVWLRREDPTYLLSYPSNLVGLADVLEARRWRIGNLREIRTVSEMLTEPARERIEAVFGVPVVDLYSTQEVGLVALQVPGHRTYAVHAEDVIVEVLRPDGTACGPGEVGRVVITPLHNFATVLLRYDIGDYAVVGGPSPCGRTLPTLERILGRVRNLLRFPDGRTSWPVFHDHKYRSVAPVTQYQIVQKALDRLELRLAAERGLTADEKGRIVDILCARVGHRFDVDVVQVDRIDRDPSGKFEDFRSEIA